LLFGVEKTFIGRFSLSINFRLQKIKFFIQLFFKKVGRVLGTKSLRSFYACKRVFEGVWGNFSQVKKVPLKNARLATL